MMTNLFSDNLTVKYIGNLMFKLEVTFYLD